MLDCVQLCHGARPAVVVDGEAAAGERVYLAGSGSADPVVSARAAAALAVCWVEGLSVQSVPERPRCDGEGSTRRVAQRARSRKNEA